jgi:hypothetical protein
MHLARILELLLFCILHNRISREKWEAIRNVQSRRGDEQRFFFLIRR